MNVGTIISAKGSDVCTISRSSALYDAVRLLGEKNIGAVVVVDEQDQCCGILSERDIVRQLSATATPEGHLQKKVEECMTAEVHTCTLSSNLEDILPLMTAMRIRHLPVVENNRLAGIISIGDVVKHKIDKTEREAEELRSYIATG